MRSLTRWSIAVIAVPLLLAACRSLAGSGPSGRDSAPPTSTPESPAAVLMPDLIGLPSAEAGRRLGAIEASAKLGLSSSWGPRIFVRCGVRPSSVVHQEPAAGTPLKGRTMVQIRTAALDLEEFRGPCEPADGDLGPVTGPDAVLARQFYRFAADPSLDAPFVSGEVWIGIEHGPTAISLGEAERADLAAWELGALYAERTGPFSALDTVASSGGYYELHDGVVGTCPSGRGKTPPELAGVRAISLTAPSDTISSCLEWWGVTLFLDDENRIRGVALRLGSP